MHEMLNFTHDSDVSPEHEFQNYFSFIRDSRGVMTGKKMNVLSCQESEGSDCRDRGMSVKSEVGCLSVLKKCQKILADIFL
jgi:hypothetical protein